MKTPPNHTAFESAPDKANSNTEKKFTGTDNPRELRAIHALLTRPQPREHLDRSVGCSNAPDLVSRLRRRGLEIPCSMIDAIDRDGKDVKRGVYQLTDGDKRKVRAWLRLRGAA